VRILLIGGNGFIGRHVLTALRQQGHALAVFHRGTGTPTPGVSEIHGDRNRLRDCSAELKRFAPEVVVDFVVSSGPQADQLMDVFRGEARRIVMLSSMDVYRAVGIMHGTESGPLQEVPLTEESELRHGRRPYSAQNIDLIRKVFSWVTDDYDKIPAEQAVMNDAKLPGTVLRLPMIYGPGDPLRRFHPIVKRITDGRRNIILPETLAAWRSPRGYIGNVAAAITLAATDERAAGRIYNVCEEPPFSELEWAKKIAIAMEWGGEFVVLPDERTPKHLLKPGNAAQHWTATSARIRHELGYVEPIAIEEAIRQTVHWEKQAGPPAFPADQFDYAAEDAALAPETRH
jgi:nucleoside-diphosphate-sugar epimerase